MKRTKDKLIYIALLFVLTTVFAGYYYGIQVTFLPDQEALDSVISSWKRYNAGETPEFWHLILRTVCYGFVPFFGLSYKTLRLSYTFLYALYVVISLDIVLRNQNNGIRWNRLPFYVLFMVLLPIHITSSWGSLGNGWIQYPMNQHPEAMLCTLVGIWILYRYMNAEGNRKTGLLILLLAWNVFSLKMANQIWIIAFLVPELLYFCGRYMKKKNWVSIGAIIASAGYLVLKLLSIKIVKLQDLFAMKGDAVGFFKSTEWCSFADLPSNLCNYLTAVLSIFGCDFTKLNVYNVTIVLYLLKIVLVAVIFKLVFKNLKRSEKNGLEFIISWGFVFLSVFWMFSNYAQDLSHHVRYLMILLPYGTILLCMNLETIGDILKIPELNRQKNAVIIACCLICALIPYGEWKVSSNSLYDREYNEVLQMVEQKGLHTGVWTQSFALGKCVYVLSGGNYSLVKGKFYNEGNTLVFNENADEIYDYLIVEDNGNIGDVISSGDVYNYLENNEPDEDIALCDGTVHMYIFYDGIHTGEAE